METEAPVIRLVVLIPHRDQEGPLRAWSRQLFAGGLSGAWSFPPAAPLAILRRPLEREELKALALALREASLKEGRGGWIRSGEAVREPLEKGAEVYGPLLDLPFPEDAAGVRVLSEASARRFSRPLLAAALVRGKLPEGLPPPPPLSFRAAALANLVYRPLAPEGEEDAEGFSFHWRIGKPAWLPPVRSAPKPG